MTTTLPRAEPMISFPFAPFDSPLFQRIVTSDQMPRACQASWKAAAAQFFSGTDVEKNLQTCTPLLWAFSGLSLLPSHGAYVSFGTCLNQLSSANQQLELKGWLKFHLDAKVYLRALGQVAKGWLFKTSESTIVVNGMWVGASSPYLYIQP